MAIARTVFLALLLALGVAPLAEAQNGKPLFIAADMVRDRGGSGPACVLTSRFMRKEGVAWRIRVQDATGTELDDKSLKSVVVELSDAGARFGAWTRSRTRIGPSSSSSGSGGGAGSPRNERFGIGSGSRPRGITSF